MPGTQARGGAGAASFSVLQFNILADFLCMTSHHSNVPRRYRVWHYRRPLLLALLQRSEASLICLEEVQPDHYKEIEASLVALGYGGVYSPKMGADGRPIPAFRGRTIGNALFYRCDTFHNVDERGGGSVVPFASLLARHHCTDAAQRSHYSRGAQVAVVLHLQHRTSGRTLLVACTHISCNWQNPDTQLAQVAVLCQQLEGMRTAATVPEEPAPAVLLCGDFNSKPDSGAYEFLTTGALAAQAGHPATRPLPAMNVEPLPLLAGASGPRHSLELASAYHEIDGSEPPITNITGRNGGHPGFEDCLDYVLYSRRTLAPCAVAPLPPEAQLRAENTGGLPNSWCPSDHLPLGATFRFL